MTSDYAGFWKHESFAVVGHSAKKKFPILTYRGLKSIGKTVLPVDPSAQEIDGDRAYPDFASLPRTAEAVVLEVPKEETRDWVAKVADAGIRDVWIHMNTETPEALALASERGLKARNGTCAVMYVKQGPSYHSIHKWIMKAAGKF